jgi:hypothetical protein
MRGDIIGFSLIVFLVLAIVLAVVLVPLGVTGRLQAPSSGGRGGGREAMSGSGGCKSCPYESP